MLYRILKLLFIFLIKVFFRRIHVEHRERVPVTGPVILVSNHPNTMMDPLLVALLSGRNPHFLGKSTLFASRIARWFFASVHVLPVYRREDAEQDMSKNTEIFQRCFESLAAGNALVIMPEGISQMDGTLHEIKTGTARIGLGAENQYNFELGVQIIPTGINYSSPTDFFSDVHCRFGRPITLDDLQELYRKDAYEAVYQVTNQIRDALEKLTTSVASPESAEVLQNLQEIYKLELTVDPNIQGDQSNQNFSVTKGMAEAINWYQRLHPAEFRKLDGRMTAYLAKIEGLELRDDLLSTARGQKTVLKRFLGMLGALGGLPFYLWGLLNNYIPFRFPAWLVTRLATEIEYLSTIKMLSGFFMFGFSYTLQGLLVWYFTGSGTWTAIYLISLIPAGRFALYYHDIMQRYRQHLRIFTLFLKRKTLMYEIIQERMALIEALDAAKVEFMERAENKSGSRVGKDDSET